MDLIADPKRGSDRPSGNSAQVVSLPCSWYHLNIVRLSYKEAQPIAAGVNLVATKAESANICFVLFFFFSIIVIFLPPNKFNKGLPAIAILIPDKFLSTSNNCHL